MAATPGRRGRNVTFRWVGPRTVPTLLRRAAASLLSQGRPRNIISSVIEYKRATRDSKSISAGAKCKILNWAMQTPREFSSMNIVCRARRVRLSNRYGSNCGWKRNVVGKRDDDKEVEEKKVMEQEGEEKEERGRVQPPPLSRGESPSIRRGLQRPHPD